MSSFPYNLTNINFYHHVGSNFKYFLFKDIYHCLNVLKKYIHKNTVINIKTTRSFYVNDTYFEFGTEDLTYFLYRKLQKIQKLKGNNKIILPASISEPIKELVIGYGPIGPRGFNGPVHTPLKLEDRIPTNDIRALHYMGHCARGMTGPYGSHDSNTKIYTRPDVRDPGYFNIRQYMNNEICHNGSKCSYKTCKLPIYHSSEIIYYDYKNTTEYLSKRTSKILRKFRFLLFQKNLQKYWDNYWYLKTFKIEDYKVNRFCLYSMENL